MRFRLNSSTGFILSAVLVFAAGYGAWRAYAAYQLSNFEFTDIEPGRVSLIAIHPRAGYRIVVSNQVAHLAEIDNVDFEAPDREVTQMTANSRRLPIRELIESLNGDAEALSYLVMTLNDMKPDEIQQDVPVWRAEDLRAAFAGDAELREQLEKDLHIQLDGTPFLTYRVSAQAGIVVDAPVKVTVPVGGVPTEIEARVQEEYLPSLYRSVFRETERANKFVTETDLLGYYRQEAQKMLDGEVAKEDIQTNLEAIIGEGRLQGLALRPKAVLDEATVMLNQNHIESASYGKRNMNRSTYYDLSIRLTPEGRMRLWKYSHENQGFQLLLIVDGVAIAAPRISTELAQRTVKITQLEVETLVKDAVNAMNEASS